jgi:hypothetical protein
VLFRSAPQFAKAVGVRSRYWKELKLHVHAPVVEEWKYYGKTIGWTLKLFLGKRNLCFVTACDRYFAISFVLGDKAVEAAKASALPVELVQQLVNARKYVEGRGIRIEVKSRRTLEHAKMLFDIKQGK